MLELKNVSYVVKDENGKDKEILKNINLTIDERFVAITGPNGGGKSTLAKIIAGIYQPTSGQILFDGEDITYTFELSDDLNFSNILARYTDLSIPTANMGKLPAGQYFMRVTAHNESGESQYAFDYYLLEKGKAYGIKCFYIDAKGQVVEDIYVEE